MSFLYGDSLDGLDLFLTRVRNLVVGWAPACLALVWFLTKEEGWHLSFLALCVVPPVAAYLGIQAKREIRTGPGVDGERPGRRTRHAGRSDRAPLARSARHFHAAASGTGQCAGCPRTVREKCGPEWRFGVRGRSFVGDGGPVLVFAYEPSTVCGSARGDPSGRTGRRI
ncbi:hypothetical protein [Streptomyces sp. NPDC055287]